MSKSTWNRISLMEQTDMADLMLFRLLLLLPIIAGASAACSNTYEVGGPGQTWTIPSDPNFFITWAASVTFYPGDCLQFNRVTTASVYQLSESDYQICSVFNPLNSWFGIANTKQIVDPFPSQSSYPASFYFSSPYFCSYGMKFAATVSDPSSAPPSPGGTNSSSKIPPPPPPPGTSATKPGSTTLSSTLGSRTPSSTLAGSAPSSTPLSTKSIAGIVAGVVAALTGGAGLAYKFHNNFTCCVFNHNSSAANGTAANGAGNGAGYEVRNGVGNGAGNGAGYGVRNGAGYGVRNGVGNGAGNGAGYGVRNGAGYGVQIGVGNGFGDGVPNGYGVQNGVDNGFGDGVGTSAWV